jgi:hypothetical protein
MLDQNGKRVVSSQQNHMDHSSARYYHAKQSLAKTGKYDDSDIDIGYIYQDPKKVAKDFPNYTPKGQRKKKSAFEAGKKQFTDKYK